MKSVVVPFLRIPQRTGSDYFDLLFDGVPFAVLGIISLVFGVRWLSLLIWGQSWIELSRDELVVRTEWWIWHKEKRIAKSEVTEIAVVSGFDSQNFPGFLRNLTGLRFGQEVGEDSIYGAIAHPRSVTEALANAIRERLRLSNPEREISIHEESAFGEANTVGEIGFGESTAEVLSRFVPEGVEDLELGKDGALKFHIPAKGFFKGSHGVGSFSVFWGLSVALFLAVAIFAMIQNASEGGGNSWLLPLFMMPFIMVGILTFRFALKMGTGTISVSTKGDCLQIDENWIFGRLPSLYEKQELKAIEAGASGITVNGKALPELRLVPNEGKPKKLFRQLNRKQVNWIAAFLRIWAGLERGDQTQSDAKRKTLLKS